MRTRSILSLIVSALVAAYAAAQAPAAPAPAEAPQPAIEGFISLGGQGDSSSGETARFRELNQGEQEGVFLETLHLRSAGGTPWTLNARYSTGGRGGADFRIDNGSWRARASVTQVRSWSALAFSDEVLATGASIHSLYPGTTGLDPLFATDEPNVDLVWTEASLERDFGSSRTVVLRGGHRSRDGSRVPNIGGFSLSDLGTAAFFSPGIETVDSSSSFGTIEARMSAGALAFRAEAGVRSRENGTRFLLPAYGASSLLDLNQWDQQTSSDDRWASLDAAYTRGRVTLQGGASWADMSNEPVGRDLRVSPGGETVRGGLALAGGSVDADVLRGALGATLRLGSRATLTLSADGRTGSSEGSGDLFLRSAPLPSATTDTDRDLVGGTADFAMRFGDTRVRVRGRASATTTDLFETGPSDYIEDLTREVERTEVRGDVSRTFRRTARLRGWGLWRSDRTTVELRELTSGFTDGDGERDEIGAGVELSLGSAARRVLLSASGTSTDLENEPPLFDPVFDPSIVLATSTGSISVTRFSASTVRAFSRGSFWGELGWLSTSYEFDGLVTHAGFRPLDESIEGLVALAGGELAPRDGSRLIGRVEWIRDREDLDRTLTRGSLELAQTVRSGIEIFGRWTAGDYDSASSAFDDHSTNLFALGIRTNF